MDQYELDDDRDAGDELTALGQAAQSVYAPPAYAGPLAPVDHLGRLIHDTPCRSCGYNLRGQLPNGSCPECGAPVGPSIRTDRLAEASPYWLRSLKNGMTWMIAGIFISIGFIFVMFFVGILISMQAMQSPGGPGTQGAFVTPMPLLVTELITTVVQSLLFCIAYWMLTEAEVGSLAGPTASRATARWTSLAGYAIAPIGALIAMGQSATFELASNVLDMISGLLLVVAFPALLLYLRQLAHRVSDHGLAKQTSTVLWGYIICIAVMLPGVVMIVVDTSSSTSPGPVLGLGVLMACPALIGLFVFLIWWIVLTFMYRARFAQALRLATDQ